MSRTLKQWEAYLVGAMPRVQLLSELGLNYEDMLEIANLIKAENAKHKNVRQTTKVLVDDFPCTFVGFLASFAAQNTEREFWEAVARLINATGMELNNAKWRNHFIEILQHFKKPVFENLSFVYVANMRIHGGIPSYSLRDFFANMLMPSIENPVYIELKGAELRDALLARSAVQMFTDSTVRNFFENTEEIGIEYLEACRRVAKSYNSSRQIPNLHGLPAYVIEKLTNFLEYQEDEKHGLRRPRIKFDPEGDGLLLELPEEPISGADVRGSQARWQVVQDQKLLKEERARILRSGRDVHSEEQIIPLGYLVEPFQVRFSIPSQNDEFSQIREWTFELRSQDAPNLLAFCSEDGSLLRWSQALPAHDLLLVYPKDISLEFEGEARLIHSPDMYAEGWHNWKAEYRALAGAFALSLIQNGETVSTISIQKQLELPRLTGNVFSPNLDPKPLFIDAAPKLRIPLRPGVDISDELKRWRVEINSTWEAEPFVRQEFKVIEKLDFVEMEESAVEFNLGTLLGDEPKGTYNLHVYGPLETEIELPFRVFPSLHIKDLPEFILPTEDSKVFLNFVLPAHASLEPQAGITGIKITGQHGQYAVELDETVSQLDLNLTCSLETSVIHVPVSIPVPRIKWRLILGEDSKVEWANHSIRKQVDAFLQSAQTPALLVQMPRIEEHTNLLVLRLIDPEKPKETLQEFPVQSSVLGTNHIRFQLNAKDTVNQHKDVSVFEFQLLLVNKEGLYQPVTLFSLTREIDVSNICIEETEENLFLLWDEPSPLRNRRVFIRSLWKPWADALNIKIPDEARGKFDLLAAGYKLPPSSYEIYFYIAPSWEKDIVFAPEKLTHIVKMISAENQITWLTENLNAHFGQDFVNHFERACIYVDTKEASLLKREIQDCYLHIGGAKPKEIFAFHEWLRSYDLNTRGAVRSKMYYPEQLKCLYATYRSDDEFCQKYLGYVSQTYIKPESIVLLLEKENDPAIIFPALRELATYKDKHLLKILVDMLETGKLSDLDAVNLLRKEQGYFLLELNEAQSDLINLRLLSGLLSSGNEKFIDVSIEKIISTDKLILLVKTNLNPRMTQKYLGALVKRGVPRGIELSMELLQNGQLQEDEVTDLLVKNTRFSMSFFSSELHIREYAIQMKKLAQTDPFGKDVVSVGMYINTPIGWAQIRSMVGKSNMQASSMQEDQVLYYYLNINLGFQYPLKAVIDTEQRKLSFPYKIDIVYRCEYCGLISDSKNHITGHKERHPEIQNWSFTSIPSPIIISDNLEIRTTHPEKLNNDL